MRRIATPHNVGPRVERLQLVIHKRAVDKNAARTHKIIGKLLTRRRNSPS